MWAGEPISGRTWGLMKQTGKHPPAAGETRVDREAIGDRLRQMFDDVVNEPVPDDFLELLRQADERESPEGADAEGAQ